MPYGKFIIYKKQISYDGGETWEDTDPLETTTSGESIETYDTLEECESAMTFDGKYKFKLTDSSIVSASCESSSILTSADTNAYKSTLEAVEIGHCTTSMDNEVFKGFANLKSCSIGNNLTLISDKAFFGCGSLLKCEIGDSVGSIGLAAFYDCENLRNITIPNSVTVINDAAFQWCITISSVTIPNSVTTIGSDAFDNCRGLQSITIGNGVTSIGNRAFVNCNPINGVTCLAPSPPTLSTYDIFDVNASFKIYVPASSVSIYKTSHIWSNYASRIEAFP